MKIITKKNLATCVAAAFMMILPLTASAATDKLIVKDEAGTGNAFVVQDTGKTTVSGSIASTGNNATALELNTELVQGINYDVVTGLKVSPTVNTNGFLMGGLIAADISADVNTWNRLIFSNYNTGTSSQAGIQMNNDVGQALITFYGSNYSSATLQNYLYYKNAVGGMKYVAFTGSDIGFGVGTTADSATALVINSSNNVAMSSLAGVGTSAFVCVNNSGVVFASTTACQ